MKSFVLRVVCSSLVLKNSTVQLSNLYYVYNGNSRVSAGVMASFVIRYIRSSYQTVLSYDFLYNRPGRERDSELQRARIELSGNEWDIFRE